MNVTLTPDQQAWINAHVATGEFESAQDAIRQLLDERIAERAEEDDIGDIAWAKPLVDEALAEADRGLVVTREQMREHTAALLASFKT